MISTKKENNTEQKKIERELSESAEPIQVDIFISSSSSLCVSFFVDSTIISRRERSNQHKEPAALQSHSYYRLSSFLAPSRNSKSILKVPRCSNFVCLFFNFITQRKKKRKWIIRSVVVVVIAHNSMVDSVSSGEIRSERIEETIT